MHTPNSTSGARQMKRPARAVEFVWVGKVGVVSQGMMCVDWVVFGRAYFSSFWGFRSRGGASVIFQLHVARHGADFLLTLIFFFFFFFFFLSSIHVSFVFPPRNASTAASAIVALSPRCRFVRMPGKEAHGQKRLGLIGEEGGRATVVVVGARGDGCGFADLK